MKLSNIIVLAAFAMTCPGLAHAEKIYKWTDEKGVVHFSQTKPPGQANSTVKIMGDTKSPEDSTKTTDEKAEEESSSAREESSSAEEGCIEGVDSFNDHGNVVCCNERCVKERFEKGLEFSCYARECHEEVAKLRFQQDEKKRRAAEAQYERSRRNAQARQEAMQEARDRKTVEDCKRARNDYCDKGAEGIRKTEAERDAMYQLDKEYNQWRRGM